MKCILTNEFLSYGMDSEIYARLFSSMNSIVLLFFHIKFREETVLCYMSQRL